MESSEGRKRGLNLPVGMSGTSLRLDTFSSFRLISNLSSPLKALTCSDRFIPCRSSSRLHTFGIVEKASPVKEGSNSDAYSRLLKSELFGSDFASPSSVLSSSPAGGASALPISPSKDMLRFKTNSSRGPSFLSCIGNLDARVKLDVVEHEDSKYYVSLAMMASKASYENAAYLKALITQITGR